MTRFGDSQGPERDASEDEALYEQVIEDIIEDQFGEKSDRVKRLIKLFPRHDTQKAIIRILVSKNEAGLLSEAIQGIEETWLPH